MAGKVHCAVLGLGRLGWTHAANLVERVGGADLVAVADVVEERAADFARQYDIPSYTSNIEKVLDDPHVDAVVIVTPTPTHATLIQQAAAAGKAIFVEKPITLSLEEAQVVCEAVQSSGAFCQVGFMRRYDPAYAAAREQIKRGTIGKPLHFKAVSRDPQCPPEGYIKDSGRIFADMSIHDYDIARFLMGEEVDEVTALGAVVKNDFLVDYHDIDQAFTYLHFVSGATGDIEGSRNAGYGYDIRAEVIGSEGTVQVGALTHHHIRLLNGKGQVRDILPGFLERFAESYVLEMVDFVKRVRSGDEPAVTVEDGYKALAIAMAATRSFDERRTVSV